MGTYYNMGAYSVTYSNGQNIKNIAFLMKNNAQDILNKMLVARFNSTTLILDKIR